MGQKGGTTRLCLVSVVLLLVAPVVSLGQVNRAAASAWEPPRTLDGQPNIQGFWHDQERMLSGCDLETGFCNSNNARLLGIRDGLQGVKKAVTSGKPVSAIVDPPDGKIPYQPWAAAIREKKHRRHELMQTPGYEDANAPPIGLRDISPELSCVLGLPRLNYFPEFQIVQAPGYVLMFWERTRAYRVIPLTTQPHVSNQVKLLMGDARGRWEGNTLIVETTNFNDWSWFDSTASFHSDAMSLLERFTYVDGGTLRYEVTVTDPIVFTQPWTFVMTIRRVHENENYEFMEYACAEGERSKLKASVVKGRR
jgi:hypothetical protein